MRSTILVSLSLLSLAAVGAAQKPRPSLYYIFEEGAGASVLNYASESGVAPAEAKIVSTNSNAWAPGRRGKFALRGAEPGKYNYLDTGWKGPLQGEFTIAFALKARTKHTGVSEFFSNLGSFRAFTGGAAGKGLRVDGWGGKPAALDLKADIQTAAQNGWVHVALVIDAKNKRATYYVDAKAQTPIPITTGANVPGGGTTFRVGAHKDTRTASAYDIDEFILWPGVVSPAQIRTWAESGYGSGTPYGKGCRNIKMERLANRPTLGEQYFYIGSRGPAGALCCQMMGTSRLRDRNMKLPFQLDPIFPPAKGADCNILASADLIVLEGIVPPSGRAIMRLQIPVNPWLLDHVLYTQTLLLTRDFKTMLATNGYSFVIKKD